jgi:hypothetical protein
MEYKPQIEKVLKRYNAFWKKDVYDRPPIRIRFPVKGESEDEWTVACQNDDTHYQYWDNILSQRAELGDDEVPTATLDMGPAFMSGVMGVPVYFKNGTSWSEHTLKDWSELKKLKETPLDDSNPWLRKLKDRIKYFIEKSSGKCAVGVAMLTGPGDIMTALRGSTDICMDFYLYPDEVRELAKICTNACIKVAQMQFDLIPPLNGGYCDNYGIWTPGRSSYFADDISTLVSPELYKEKLYPFDCQIADSLETPWLHVHSEESRLIPEFVKIPRLVAMQVVNDRPAGPTLKEVLPNLKKVQEKHSLILRKYPMEELKEILKELSPKGLMIDTQCSSLEEAKSILKEWNRESLF